MVSRVRLAVKCHGGIRCQLNVVVCGQVLGVRIPYSETLYLWSKLIENVFVVFKACVSCATKNCFVLETNFSSTPPDTLTDSTMFLACCESLSIFSRVDPVMTISA